MGLNAGVLGLSAVSGAGSSSKVGLSLTNRISLTQAAAFATTSNLFKTASGNPGT